MGRLKGVKAIHSQWPIHCHVEPTRTNHHIHMEQIHVNHKLEKKRRTENHPLLKSEHE